MKHPTHEQNMMALGTRHGCIHCNDGDRHASDGFTLLEIMVAVSIAALGLVTVMQLFAMGLKATKKTEEMTTAVLYAKNLAGDIMTRNILEEGIESGQFDPKYSWEREVILYDMPEAGLPEHIIEKEIDPIVDTYLIKIRIFHVRRNGAILELETLKTVFHQDYQWHILRRESTRQFS